MSGKLARCPPGFIVKSRGWFVICARSRSQNKQRFAVSRASTRSHHERDWRTHLVLIFLGCGEVEEAVNLVIRHVFRFDVCGPSSSTTLRQSQYNKISLYRAPFCCAPSSSSPRYLSKMGSSLMASTAARLVVRFRLKSLDWK